MSIFKEFGLLALLVLCGSAYSVVSGLASWNDSTPPAGAIHPSDTPALNPLWLDLRTQTEFNTQHIPGALHFDPTNWDDNLIVLMEHWLNAPRPIIVYCASESCNSSAQIAARLRDALPEAEIYYLLGGWDAWSAAKQ